MIANLNQAWRSTIVIGFVLFGGTEASTAQQSYPTRPIRIVVPFAAGGLVDVLARITGEKLHIKWRQPVVVENRIGASGNLGADVVAKAAPDGYTLLVAPPPPLAINESLFSSLPFDPSAFEAVSVLASVPNVLLANPSVNASDLKEFIQYAKDNPEKLSYASTGSGGTPHLTAELFKRAAGVRILHVPYRGMPPALVDLLSGQVTIMFANLGDALPHIRAGKLKVLAVASKARHPSLPDVPSMSETLPDFVSETWYGAVATPKTPPEIVNVVSSAISELLRLPDVTQKLQEYSATAIGSSPSESAAYMAQERKRWREIIVSSGIKAE
jgi:tripartite-type tricarboxylate transporter receptor subunit TctC